MTYYMKLDNSHFEKMIVGTKTIEMRLWDEKRRELRIGDTIVFSDNSNEGREIEVEVTAIHLFDTFKELYNSLSLSKCGYAESEIHLADPSDMERYYSLEKQLEYGVVGIEICKK